MPLCGFNWIFFGIRSATSLRVHDLERVHGLEKENGISDAKKQEK